MALFIYVLASLVLIIAKAAQVSKQIDKGTYSLKRASPLFIVWLLLVLPGIDGNCSQGACRPEVQFGWWMETLRDLGAASGYDSEATPVVIVLLVGFVWVHVLGHVCGWLFYGGQKLFEAEA